MLKPIQLLHQCMLFSTLSEGQLAELAEISSKHRYDKGDTIFREGDAGIGFYIVASGKVKIFKSSPEGKEQILHIFGRGEPIGEVPVFHGLPYPASAEALRDSELLFFPRAQFVGLLEKHTSLALNMLAVLSKRLRRFATQIEHLSLKEVPGRLAMYLLYMAEEQKNMNEVVLDIPKGQLANLLGTSPETLSRIFLKMSEEGLIQVEGKRITLLDVAALAER
ncbi:MAG: Crp/Fnr family transcriptional regulator [Desulfobulbaceae bacterium]|nr:Crp/Fnr family transcriptional regulator [Desulfobulbaceae bacterium]